MTWVDNIYAFCNSYTQGITLMDTIEESFSARWGLQFKDGSKPALLLQNSAEACESVDLWPICGTMPVLGHVIDSRASVRPCWQATRRAMQKSFWRNAGHARSKDLSLQHKLKMLSATVLPTAEFRFSRWPPQKQIADELDTLQSRMAAVIQCLRKQPQETPQSFCRRRGRAARALCRQMGLWSDRWFSRAAKWDAHLRRHPESASGALVAWHGNTWLRARRAQFVPSNPRSWMGWSIYAGRTDTRVRAGVVHQRWDDGVELAAERAAAQHGNRA